MSTDTDTNSPKSCARNGRRGGVRRWFGLGALMMAVAIPVFAFAGAGRFGPGCHGHGEPKSAAEVRERMSFFEDRVYDRVDATPEQQETISAVLDEASTRMFAHKQRGSELREQMRAALLAETVDRARLEQLRLQGVAEMEAASRTALDVTGDIAETLTPAQRRQIADDLAHFAPHH